MSIDHLPKIFHKAALYLEQGDADEYFTDPRGGLRSVLAGVEVFLTRYEFPESVKVQAGLFIARCHGLLREVEDEGWSERVKKKTMVLAGEIRSHDWS